MVPSFESVTADILLHPAFEDCKNFVHHGIENSVYDHSVATARMAYRMACRLGVPEEELISVTRAALLHDFFGYDWRDEWFKRFLRHYRGLRRMTHMHAFVHGPLAAKRASRYFALTNKQRDAIASHMFPLAPMLPRSREGWIVTAADKMVAAKEMTQCVYRAIARTILITD
ncbi:MAG: HD domain-containing protein [Butyricicoccus sp.]